MIRSFSGETANEAWVRAAEAFATNEVPHSQGSRCGETDEILHVGLSVDDPRQRRVSARRPGLNPAFAVAETVWLLQGRSDSGFLNSWNSQLAKFAGFGPRYHGAYGARLRSHFGLDQLERAWRALSENPESRQVVLQLWDPKVDLLAEDGSPQDPDIPCNVCSLLKIRGDRLEWLQVLRSNDLFLGVPYNLIQFTMVQEVLAGWIGVGLGGYQQITDSLHVYEKDRSAIRASIREYVPAPINDDHLSLPKQESGLALSTMEEGIAALASEELTEVSASNMIQGQSLPDGYRNLLCLVIAEAARRRGWVDPMAEAVATCSNPMLREVWRLWMERFITP